MMRALLPWVLFAAAALCSCQRVVNDPPKGRTIVAFGDSLTAGHGAENAKSYPEYLEEMIGEPVLNRGVSSETAGEALQRLERDVLAAEPRIVIVWLGSNDVLRQLPPEQTWKDLAAIVDAIQSTGALVVLVGVSDMPFRPSTNDGIIRLAKEKGCVYVRNPLRGVLHDPGLKSDTVHPNTKGYRIIAERIAGEIKKYVRSS